MNVRRALAALLPAALAAAQEQTVVQVAVTSTSGRSVYLDKGSASGLATGTIVRLFPAGQPPLDVEVRVASSNSARADLPPGVPVPPVGTRGEATVTPGPAPAPPRAQPPVEHPPWTRQEDRRDPSQPLLVPAYGQRPETRPSELTGRAFLLGQWNQDLGAGRDSTYTLGRLGTSLQLANPLGQGGRAQFAGEVDHRDRDTTYGGGETDTNGRLDLLSYATGTEGFAPVRFEAGRFFSDALPELGLLDGVETLAQFEGGGRLGGAVAAYPRPFPARDTGEDVGFHMVADYAVPETRAFAGAIGFQKTWHEGEPDRDLLLLRADGRPADGLWLYGNMKVDYYTGSDTIKGSGIELTEVLGQIRYDGSGAGIGLLGSHFTWPELKRREYQDLPVELVRDGVVDRAGLSAWVRPVRPLRLSVRLDTWRDQDTSGTSGELAADWYDALATGTHVYAALFQSDGTYTSGPGGRVRLRRPFGEVSVQAGWALYQYDYSGLLAGAESYTRQSLDVGANWSLDQVDVDLSVERWFGDQEEAFALTLFVQYRF